MSVPIFQVDSFTAEPFGGNPAGVCLLREEAAAAWMQAVAAEMNLSETAFLVPRADAKVGAHAAARGEGARRELHRTRRGEPGPRDPDRGRLDGVQRVGVGAGDQGQQHEGEGAHAPSEAAATRLVVYAGG